MGSKASPLVRFALFYYISDMARMFPIGMQSFSVIRENNAIYVDKTSLVYKLVKEGKFDEIEKLVREAADIVKEIRG